MTHTINDCEVLLVEDDLHKKRAIFDLLNRVLPDAHITCAESLSSAISEIEKKFFKLAVVDMSIPTYDFLSDKEGGGQPESFGGAEVLRFIESESPETVSVVVTQYQEFLSKSRGQVKSLDELSSELLEEFGEGLLGVFYYSSQKGAWNEELKQALLKFEGEKK